MSIVVTSKPASMTSARGRLARLLIAATVTLPVAACSGATNPDELELRNISMKHVFPKSSPATFVRTFERFCLGASDENSLRAAGYVPLPRRAGRPSTYLVDDRRPAVVVSDKGCMVAAASRTGQTDRVRAMIAHRFPDARPVDPARLGGSVENAWALPSPDGRVLFTLRQTNTEEGSRYALAVTGGRRAP